MVRKTTVAIDEQLIQEAQAALGTTGIRDTVDAALRRAIREAARRAVVEQLATQDGLDLADAAVMAGAWR